MPRRPSLVQAETGPVAAAWPRSLNYGIRARLTEARIKELEEVANGQ